MSIRIATYNIKSGRFHPQGLEAVARILESTRPDVVALQEVDEAMRRTGGTAQTDWLARRLHMTGIFAPAMAYDGGQYGIALLSRLPLSAHERRPLFQPVYADAAARPRHDSEPRVMLGARLSLPAADGGGSRPLNLVVTHLGLTQDQRAVQVRELAGFAQTWAGGQPLAVLGDFNCDPDAPELAPLRGFLVDACAAQVVVGAARVTFPGAGHTTARAMPEPSAIDYVWLSPDVQLLSAQVLPDDSLASDHRPLVVDVEV